jgi:hypothetical protein
VHSRPLGDQPAWPRIAGSASSSSWNTGESMTNVSSPRWTTVHVVCHISLRTTTTSPWTLRACIAKR